jgi:hypothetical protein
MLDHGLFYRNGGRCIQPNLVYPIVCLKEDQSSGHSLIKSSGRNLDGVFYTVAVSTQHPATSDRHQQMVDSSLLFRQSDRLRLLNTRKQQSSWSCEPQTRGEMGSRSCARTRCNNCPGRGIEEVRDWNIQCSRQFHDCCQRRAALAAENLRQVPFREVRFQIKAIKRAVLLDHDLAQPSAE